MTKSVKWDQDPEILARLEVVAQMVLQGAKRWQIAKQLETSLRTASRDIRRVRALWRRSAEQRVETLRMEYREGYRFMQGQAYDQFLTEPSDGRPWLRLALDCQDRLVELDGVRKPTKVALTTPEGDAPYQPDALTDAERLARLSAILDEARARRDRETRQGVGGDPTGDASGVDARSSGDPGQGD